ncbi:MAG: hypothetical protein ABR524_00135 [Thermoanaerobaculia bacterium]
MEEASEFIDEQRDSRAGRGLEADPGWDLVRFDLDDEPAEGEDDSGSKTR